MQNLWSDEEALLFPGELGQRVYSSRLLGRDKSLVLHGGGNTSVKIREQSITGEVADILYVKGSGRDLEHIDADGFSPVRLDHLVKLAELESLSDPDMLNEMLTSMTRASAPSPSVEAILHAIIPARYVDHTHADAVLSVTNTKDYERHLRSIYGDTVLVVPYVMPGFSLSRLCADILPKASHQTVGLVLVKHGIFSFGPTARDSYDRMIKLVASAEEFLKAKRAWNVRSNVESELGSSRAQPAEIAALRKAISLAAGKPMILRMRRDEAIERFVGRPDLEKISQKGPPTPDHVIRTKRLPMLGRDVTAYTDKYNEYFRENAHRGNGSLASLDPAPRVVLDRALGLCAAGQSVRDADIVADLYSHTIEIIERSEMLGGYEALRAADLFDVEYWDLEQAKLQRSGAAPMLAGEIAVITGAASGIGKACAESMLARGAVVVGLDIDPKISGLLDRPEFLGMVCDVTSPETVTAALARVAQSFGGLDILVLNAGVFPLGADIAGLSEDAWRSVMQVNLDANLTLLRESHAMLRESPRGGRVVIIGSKNVSAPSPGVAAYSASKAALSQLGRVAALEWARDNIRVNQIHPDGVFDTGIWTDDVLAHRAKSHGSSVEEYRKRNLLSTEITSKDVGELAADLCGPTFSKITGAHIPMDGGSERVI
jgi:rhamnose utilization protein RhaD (predicted bifunctional aldolase and dehydrogenase)/NAD(P)-dependent dehydrogenase (short-subunit alcohol dehydrogenase family)